MAITVTEAAVKEIRRVMEEQEYEEGMFFRIGLGAGGCSGFSYKLVFDDNFDDKEDKKYDFHGLEVVVDKKSSRRKSCTSALHLHGHNRG
jgi:iron-sulfur cluster assembly protein